MHAIDTNVIVRYLTGDHPAQARKARALVDKSRVFIGKTVLLETEWVLRSVYGFAKEDVVKALRKFAGLPTVEVESADEAARALDWAEAGIDFADALHLAGASGCESFVSFDDSLVRAANRILPGRLASVP